MHIDVANASVVVAFFDITVTDIFDSNPSPFFGLIIWEYFFSLIVFDAYRPQSAVNFFVEKKRVKFDETLEISMNLGIDPRHADQMVRGVISLPNGNGKSMKVAVFAKDKTAEAAKVAVEIITIIKATIIIV